MALTAGRFALITWGVLQLVGDNFQSHEKIIIITATSMGCVVGIFWGYKRPEDMGEVVGDIVGYGIVEVVFRLLFAGIAGVVSSIF